MPITATLAIIASASMAGVPLLNGFLSKEMFFAETVFLDAAPWLEVAMPVLATVAGIFSVAYSARFVFDVFFGPPCTAVVPKAPHEPPHWMRVPVELLVLACLVVGIVPAWSVGSFLAAAATPVVGGTLPHYSLAVWHGFNLPLVMSFVALAGGGGRAGAGRARRARAAALLDQVRHDVDHRLRVRRGRGLAGQVPPPGRADAGLRRRAGELHHLHLVLGARPGAHATRGRERDDAADPAGPALAADAQGRGAAGARRLRRVQGLEPPLARPGPGRLRRRRHGRAGLAGDDAPLPAEHLALLPRQGPARGRRHQRGQRDAGGLPRLRHLRRDHRAGHRGADGICAAAPLPPGGGSDGAAAAAAHGADQRLGRHRP